MKKKECEISAVFAIEDKIDEGVCSINDKNNQEQEGRLDSFFPWLLLHVIPAFFLVQPS
jgi:hypothetical protein